MQFWVPLHCTLSNEWVTIMVKTIIEKKLAEGSTFFLVFNYYNNYIFFYYIILIKKKIKT